MGLASDLQPKVIERFIVPLQEGMLTLVQCFFVDSHSSKEVRFDVRYTTQMCGIALLITFQDWHTRRQESPCPPDSLSTWVVTSLDDVWTAWRPLRHEPNVTQKGASLSSLVAPPNDFWYAVELEATIPKGCGTWDSFRRL